MEKYLFTNLQHFNEDELDFDALQDEFESQWTEEEPEPEVTEETEEVEEETEEPTDSEEEVDEVETEEEPQKEDKADKAFAEMRRKNEELSKYEKVIRDIAEKNGISPEDVLNQYEERQLQAQAEERNVPVDVLKRLNSLEQENKQMRESQFANSFNSQVEKVKSEYGIDEAEVSKVIQFYNEQKLPVDVPFETAYKMANLDKIIESKINDTRQRDLAEKKKRQQETAIPNGDSASQVDDDAALEDEVTKYLKSEGYI